MIDPDDYWVNNPLITPVNKVVMYDSDIYDAVIGERERTIRIIEARSGHQYGYSLCNCEWCDLVYLINDVNVL